MSIVNVFVWSLAGAFAVIISGFVRALFLRASKASAVDHYYWILAARAYREMSGFPVRIHDKFLLEDERQAYPPGFGLFLAAFPEAFISSRWSTLLVVAVDLVTLLIILGAGVSLGIGALGLVVITLVYGLAPVLVAYNTQLTSRGLGNLFLVISLLAQASAASSGLASVPLAFLGACSLAAVVVTHKMTTQFFASLWLIWSFSLLPLGSWGIWIGMLTPFAALVLATLATGPRFQLLQWRAHWEIITFWGRNWRFLGAHQFRQSPIYGDPQSRAPNSFHGDGFLPAFRHLLLISSYMPIALPLPLTLLFASAPPAFILAWFASAFLAALATLYLPALKCLGAGHLYIFNVVPPTALWWGYIFTVSGPTSTIMALFVAGLAATCVCLFAGLRRRLAQAGSDDADASSLVSRLTHEPASRVAAFPVTFTERIALETDHAVFWGGHGLGFRTLEPYWPVMRKPVGEALRLWGVSYAILDLDWWPEGESVFAAQTGDVNPERFGRFALYRMRL